MKLTQQEIRFQFLNSISKEHNVSFKSIYDCMDNNKDDIDTMDRIFDSDDELSIRKRLVLLYLISRDRSAENLDYYKAIKNFKSESIDSDIEAYQAVIIAALMANTLFYVSACNWCGLIQREVRRQNDRKRNEINGYKISGIFILTFNPYKEIKFTTADIPGYAPQPFNKIHVDNINGKYYGDLVFLGNRTSKLLELRFEFFDKETKQPVQEVPFKLKADIIFNSDKSEHTIIILNQIINSSTIRSASRKINFTDGFEVCEISEVKD